MEMPNIMSLDVDSRLIPTGAKQSFNVFDKPSPIGPIILDTCFEILNQDFYTIRITDTEKKINFSIWQDGGQEGYGYVQVYTPPDRKSIAIEPMSARANALQDKEGGIQYLSAGNSQVLIWGIGFRD